MAYFGNYIAAAIKAEQDAGLDTTPASMAGRMKIRGSMISRFLNDPEPKSVHRKTLDRMVRGISKDPIVRAGLRIAYLRDQMGSGDDVDLIEISMKKSGPRAGSHDGAPRIREEEPIYSRLAKVAAKVALDSRTTKAIETILRACAKSQRFRRSVRDLADIAEHDILPGA